MLLLASVPTLGRLSAATAAPVPAGDIAHAGHAMAMAGMPHLRDAVHPAPAQPTPPPHRHDTDCAYCALLGATVPAVASALALPSAALPACAPRPWRAPTQCARPAGALGSRGPPRRA